MIFVFFCLIYFNMMISRYIHVAANGIVSFFSMSEKYIVYMYHLFLIHLSVNGHLRCFHVLAIINSAAMNTWVHVSFRIRVFSRYTPMSGIYSIGFEWTSTPAKMHWLANIHGFSQYWAQTTVIPEDLKN